MLRSIVGLLLIFFAPLLGAQSAAAVSCSNMTLGPMGSLNGFVPSPQDAWHQDISGADVDPGSATIMSNVNDLGSQHLHPDFSSIAGGNYGIPYIVVDSSQTISVPFTNSVYTDDSDMTLYPLPANLPIEGTPGECPNDQNDRHAIVLDRNQCVAYEMYQAAHCSSSAIPWSASAAALWDMLETENRPYGLTSVDAAGLSVFEGLIRYDEIAAGAINHAIRFTAVHTKADNNNGYFTAPATHAAGNLWGTDNIIGMRIRMKADFDVSGFSPTNQIILNAMKKYGMILADNGSSIFFQGVPDARWNDDDLSLLKAIDSSAFEVVKMNPVYDSASAPTGPAPTATLSPSSTQVAKGESVILTPNVSGESYIYIDKVGFMRGPVTVAPTVDTTYTLSARNAFGTTTSAVTVHVSATASSPNLKINSIADQTYGAAPLKLAATSLSSAAIQYAVTSGPAQVSGTTLTITGIGPVTIRASQSALGNFVAATVSITFNVKAAAPGLQLTAIAAQTFSTAPITVQATSHSTGAITYSIASGPAHLSGTTLTLTGSGAVTVSASQVAAGDYAAATVQTSFNVAGADPKLTLAPLTNKVYGAAPVQLSVTTLSQGSNSYLISSGPATVQGNLLTITGVGTVVVKAEQNADGGYAAATATASFQVTAASDTLTMSPIASLTFSATAIPLHATSPSSGAITYSIVGGPATISGQSLVMTGAGSVTVKATQAAAGDYASGTAETSFTITAADPALKLASVSDQTLGTDAVHLAPSSLSQAPYQFTVTGPATLAAGGVLTLTGLGSVEVQVSQAATGGYAAATNVVSFTVKPLIITTAQLSSTSVQITIAPQAAFTGSLNFSCDGLASGCVFNPATLVFPAQQTPAQTVLTIGSNSASYGSYSAVLGLLIFPFLTPLLSKRRKGTSLLLLCASLLTLASLAGCGSGAPVAAPKPNVSFTVIASYGSVSQSIPITLPPAE